MIICCIPYWQQKASCSEWPVMNGIEDKRNLRALHVRFDRNSGWPTSREAHGHGVPIVLAGVTSYRGVRESLIQGEGEQVLQRVKEGDKARDANYQYHPGTHSGKRYKRVASGTGSETTVQSRPVPDSLRKAVPEQGRDDKRRNGRND